MADEIQFDELTYAELRKVYLRNIRMRTVGECETLLAAVRALRIDRPTESDKSGERFAMQTLDRTEDAAEKQLGILRLVCRPNVSYLPPDDLH
jgi:hypothetical protein